MQKTPWPTKAVMEQIYEQKLWGGANADYYSGAGSYDPEIVQPYLQAVISFLKSFETPIAICDLGCGDFNVGKQLVNYTKEYFAIDIAENLIERNKKAFQDKNLQFLCLDIATDDLPSGDCVILRQVLQHVSNQEIASILNKLHAFKYFILTEHIPCGDFTPNLDIIAGQGIRLKKNSGVDVLAAPFNLQIKEEKELASIFLGDKKGKVVSTLYTLL